MVQGKVRNEQARAEQDGETHVQEVSRRLARCASPVRPRNSTTCTRKLLLPPNNGNAIMNASEKDVARLHAWEATFEQIPECRAHDEWSPWD